LGDSEKSYPAQVTGGSEPEADGNATISANPKLESSSSSTNDSHTKPGSDDGRHAITLPLSIVNLRAREDPTMCIETGISSFSICD
jgi:hypothetical protein